MLETSPATTVKFRRITGSGSAIHWAEGTRWATMRDPQEDMWVVVKFPTADRPDDFQAGENFDWCPTKDIAKRAVVRHIETDARKAS